MISDTARIHNDVPEVHFDSDGFDNLEICHSVPLLTTSYNAIDYLVRHDRDFLSPA